MPRTLPDRCAPDCIREFQAAARERCRDAQSLAAADRRTAAIYLWGYAAELTLKAAYFRVIGFGETQPIRNADLRAAATEALALGIVWPSTNFHNLKAWAELLVGTRLATPGLAYPVSTFGQVLTDRAQRLHRLWRETLRYHRNVAYSYELDQVRDAATWLVLQSPRL